MSWDELVKTFRDGDVLYGLDKPRNAAKAAILNNQEKLRIKVLFMGCFPLTKQADRIVIQNTITDSVFRLDEVADKLQYGGDMYKTDQQISSNKAVASEPGRAIGFRNHLRDHQKWNIEKGIRDDDVKGGGWIKNKKANDTVTAYDRGLKAWQRTSKAGLEYQTKVRQRTVHFILDEIDYERVLGKRVGDITSAELRWLYRRRADSNIRNRICFWEKGRCVDPPWEWPGLAEKFATYVPKSEKQIKSEDTEARSLQRTIEHR